MKVLFGGLAFGLLMMFVGYQAHTLINLSNDSQEFLVLTETVNSLNNQVIVLTEKVETNTEALERVQVSLNRLLAK